MANILDFPRDLGARASASAAVKAGYRAAEKCARDALHPTLAEKIDPPDISTRLCPLYPVSEAHRDAQTAIPMFSFDAPSVMLWNQVFAYLIEKGWSEADAIAWLQSIAPRHAMERELGTMLKIVARRVAAVAKRSDIAR